MKELLGIVLFIMATTCFIAGFICVIRALTPKIKKLLYRILRNDMIKRLKRQGFKEPDINTALLAFGLSPTSNTFTIHFELRPEVLQEEIRKSKDTITDLRSMLKIKAEECERLKNPPHEPKFKIGQTVGKFAVSKTGTSECNPYECVDKDGDIFRFTENQIEAMMKLNPESK